VTIASAYGAECEVTTVSAILTAGQYAVYVSTDVYTGVPGDTPYRGTLTCEPYSLPAGTNCAYPVPVSLPTDLPYTDLNQTNCGMMDDYFYSEMDDYDGGEDIIYELIVTETVTVDITMDPGTTTYSGIAVFNGCPDVGVLLYQATGSAASLRELESIALTAGTYYIMIDTWAPPECITSFDLTITNAYCDVVCPPEHVLEGEETCYDEYVDLYNGGCDVVVPAFTDLQCGTTVCGTAGTFLLNAVETRDTDWYSFTLEEISEVVWTGAAEFNVTMALVSGVPECDPEVILISGSEGSCDVVTLTTTLAAGSYAAFVAPTDFTGVICGSEYYATLTCTPAPPRGDYCINPYLIESLPYYTIGTTADNTDTHGIVSPDEWYQFTLDAPALVTVELCGPDTDYDTYMHLIASDCTTEIAFNDDGPECPESAQNYAPSEISLELEPGTYNVSVEGYSSNFGVYNLDIHIDEPCVVECPPESADEGEVVCFDEYVDATNGGCDAAVPAFTDIECGATVCGTAGTFLLNAVETRDTDWYSFTLLETSDVVWTGAAEFNLTMALVSGVPACDPEVIVISGSEGSCDVVNLTTTLVAGSYAAFIAPTAFTGVVCGSAYYATLTCTPWSPPPGDYCINPYLIESLPYSTTGTTTDNTDTHGNPSPDEWYQFTLENSALVTVELCGPDTDYDTSLRLLGADCETQFGYSNDGPECPESDQAYAPSEISLELEPGSYNVSVEGHSSNFGIYNLDIHIDEPCVVECPPESTDEGEVVCYDEYIDYYNSGCLQFPYFFGAIANGETICGTSGTYLVADVLTRDTDWFRFELTEASEVSVSCEAEFPLYLVIVSVADCSAPIIAEQYGEACEVVTLASLLDAGAYAVFVASDGQGLVTCGTPYRVTLNYTPIVPPVGDSCADPLVAPCLPYQFFSTTANRTDTYGNPAPDEWTRFTLEEASHVVITLCGGGTVYDSYLSLLDADCVTEILYNDDSCDMQSEIAADLEAGTYVICVEGYESNSGEYQLDIIVPEPVVQIQYSEGGAILTISGGEGAAAYNIYRSLLPFDDGEDDPEFLLVDTILNGADDEIWTDYVTGSYFYQVTASCIPE
jgi:hypothetical protein